MIFSRAVQVTITTKVAAAVSRRTFRVPVEAGLLRGTCDATDFQFEVTNTFGTGWGIDLQEQGLVERFENFHGSHACVCFIFTGQEEPW